MSESTPSVQFQEFDVRDRDDRCIRWIRWLTKLKRYFEHETITDDKKKINTLFLFGGYDLEEFYNNAKAKCTIETQKSNNDDDSDGNSKTPSSSGTSNNTPETFDSVIDILTARFNPKENVILNRCKIRNIMQFKDEPFDEFLARVRECANQCKLADVESEIVTQVINGCHSFQLKTLAAKRENISLAEIVKEANLIETISQMKNEKARNFDNDIENDDDVEP